MEASDEVLEPHDSFSLIGLHGGIGSASVSGVDSTVVVDGGGGGGGGVEGGVVAADESQGMCSLGRSWWGFCEVGEVVDLRYTHM